MTSGLYISRRVNNGGVIHDWAAANGLPFVVAPADLHVTIFSDPGVSVAEFAKINAFADQHVLFERGTIVPNKYRDAISLEFYNPMLSRFSILNNEDVPFGARGMSRLTNALWHVTVSYRAPEIDVASLTPFTGIIEFGPEVCVPYAAEWENQIREVPPGE